MTIQGKITDATTGFPIPGVSLTVEWEDGGSTGVGTTTNSQGYFSISNTVVSEPQLLAITHVSYKPSWYILVNENESIDLLLAPKITELENVVVTATKKKSPALLIAGAGLLLLAITDDDRKKRVGKIDSETVRTGATVAVGLISVIAVWKVLQKLNLLPGPGAGAVKDEILNPNSPWKPKFLDSIPHGTNYLVITGANMQTYTKTIHDAFTVFQDNYNEILGVFNQLKSQSQVAYLAKGFQERYNMDLLTFLTDGGGILPWDGLSDAHLKEITDLVKKLPQYQ